MSFKFARFAGIYILIQNIQKISNFYPLEVVDFSSMTQL